jgi:alpha/beta hydrolase family protein
MGGGLKDWLPVQKDLSSNANYLLIGIPCCLLTAHPVGRLLGRVYIRWSPIAVVRSPHPSNDEGAGAGISGVPLQFGLRNRTGIDMVGIALLEPHFVSALDLGWGDGTCSLCCKVTGGGRKSRKTSVGHSRNSQTTTAKTFVPEASEILAVQADDCQPIQLWRTGRGRPLILLHEWTADHRAWGRFAPILADRFTVHAWDARGHGATGATPAPEAEPATVERMARDLKQVIDTLALEAPLLVGHSMGALTLWQYLALYGCRGLGGLCIIDQSPKLVTGCRLAPGHLRRFPGKP